MDDELRLEVDQWKQKLQQIEQDIVTQMDREELTDDDVSWLEDIATSVNNALSVLG
jgi:hypothetical protein